MPQPYTIKYGDTLSALATKNGVTVADLMTANPSITDANKIMAGNTLVVPVKQTAVPTIQTTTGTRATDQKNLNTFNSTTTQLQQSEAQRQASFSAAGLDSSGKPIQQTTSSVQNGNTNTPMSSVESLYLGGDQSAESIYGKITSQVDPNADPLKPKPTLQDVQAQIQKLSADPSARSTSESTMQLNRLETERATYATQFEEMKKSLDAENRAAVDSINATFASRIAHTKDKYATLLGNNIKASYATDAFRYTPQQAEGLATNVELGLINQLSQLDAEQRSALAQAATAKRQGDWELLGKQMDMYAKNDTARSTAISKLVTLSQQENTRRVNEAKIQADAEKMASATQAKSYATSVAQDMLKQITGLSEEAQATLIENKAKEMKIDPSVLRSALIDQTNQNKLKQAQLTKAQQQAIPKAPKAGGSGGSGTRNPNGTKKTATQLRNEDVTGAIEYFQAQMKAKGWKGVNPDDYSYYKKEIMKLYGSAGVTELDKQMTSLKLRVDRGV